jgi:cellulose synthase/poly-beta-1,6-N-acetylglucosamine synthase-like glycosyltransferase
MIVQSFLNAVTAMLVFFAPTLNGHNSVRNHAVSAFCGGSVAIAVITISHLANFWVDSSWIERLLRAIIFPLIYVIFFLLAISLMENRHARPVFVIFVLAAFLIWVLQSLASLRGIDWFDF